MKFLFKILIVNLISLVFSERVIIPDIYPGADETVSIGDTTFSFIQENKLKYDVLNNYEYVEKEQIVTISNSIPMGA